MKPHALSTAGRAGTSQAPSRPAVDNACSPSWRPSNGDRFKERSGQSQEMFCKSEGISKASLSNWRRRLRSDDKPMPSKAPAPANFIEIGSTSRPLDAGLRVRLDLGAGVVLELSRL